MKRAPYTYGADLSGRKYWRSLNEYAETPAFKEAMVREHPEGASVLADPVSRRSFIGLMGASLGLAGLTGCRKPEEHILPYNKRPENLIDGIPQFYATAMTFGGSVFPLLVESHEGRPTKIEGNPSHPYSRGGTSVFAQASVLDLYDPQRSQGTASKGEPVQGKDQTEKNWQQFAGELAARAKRADGNGGATLAILTDGHRSQTLLTQLAAVRAKWPQAKIYRYDPQGRQNERDGLNLAFGQPLESTLELTGARVILSIDSDFLIWEGSSVKQARGYADGRSVKNGTDNVNRLYAVESRYTITGSTADHRLRLSAREIPAFTAALANELATRHGLQLGEAAAAVGSLAQTLSPSAEKWVKAVAADLVAFKGTGAVIAGVRQPPIVHGLVGLINQALSNTKTVQYHKPFDATADGPAALLALANAMKNGGVETLLILGGNPVFDAPADADFKNALGRVAFSAHLSEWINETGKATTWHVPRAHYLESWSDAVADDGTAAIVQPLIAPIFDSKTDTELIEILLGGIRKPYELVRTAYAALGGKDESEWRRWLNDGIIPKSMQPAENVTPTAAALAGALRGFQAGGKEGYEVTFHPDSHAFDGRFANNGWMQEMPDQMTKQSWGNAALVAHSTAQTLGVQDGDYIDIKTKEGHSVSIPVLVQPGQAENSIALTYGQGRTAGMNDNVAGVDGVIGVDTYPLRTSGAFWLATGVTVTKGSGHEELARTQEHHTMEGRPVAREGTLVQFKKNPAFAPAMVAVERFNLWDPKDDQPYKMLKWGMTIDLNTCIGCNACMVACQAENNIPLTGKDGVIRGREMHWIRVDRYFEGNDVENPPAIMQPIGCQQCENAPCELVCPVAATEHSPEGLNEMAYNRCVGTRYCANNCPYKVRRFNFFNYNRDVPELRKMQFNPNVTVRSRGVMEKCTYCVQRIQEGKIAAKRENRFIERNGETIPEIRDGDIVSACAQTCPTGAIKFGDLNDDKAEVAKLSKDPRAYGLLAEINTRPRTSFLARLRNPNPELEKA